MYDVILSKIKNIKESINMSLIIPKGYESKLEVIQTQQAIKD